MTKVSFHMTLFLVSWLLSACARYHSINEYPHFFFFLHILHICLFSFLNNDSNAGWWMEKGSKMHVCNLCTQYYLLECSMKHCPCYKIRSYQSKLLENLSSHNAHTLNSSLIGKILYKYLMYPLYIWYYFILNKEKIQSFSLAQGRVRNRRQW